MRPRRTLNLAVGLFGDNESISRSSGAPVTDTPDESWGVNGRATWEPMFDTGKIVHLGLSGYYRTALKSGDIEDAVRLTDRPNIRVDNGNIADSGVITDVRSLRYGGAEAAAVFGPFTRGRRSRPAVARSARLRQRVISPASTLMRSYFLTGETRPFRGGNFDRVRPFKELGKDGLGAFELALALRPARPVRTRRSLARAGNEARSFTLGLNWYFNPYAKLMFNWVRFTRRQHAARPDRHRRPKGDAIATRLHLDF